MNTIVFDAPVDDPLFAIWSLGSPSAAATFTFAAGQVPVFPAGGPNAGFGGSPIDVAGTVIEGVEGNGVVKFEETYSSLSWTNTPENFYAFTVGLADDLTSPPSVPEPATLSLLAAGVVVLLARVADRRRSLRHRPARCVDAIRRLVIVTASRRV